LYVIYKIKIVNLVCGMTMWYTESHTKLIESWQVEEYLTQMFA